MCAVNQFIRVTKRDKRINGSMKPLSLQRDHSPVEICKLSKSGHNKIQDFRDIIQTARLMVKEKNADC